MKKILLIIVFLILIFSCQTVQNDLPMETPEERGQSALIILGNPLGTYPVSLGDIPRLLEYASDPNPAVRHMAVYQLGQLSTTSFYDDLLPLLIDSDISVSRNTEELLLRDDRAARRLLRGALSGEDRQLVLKALDLLVSMDDRESLPEIIELFLSEDSDIVDKAIIAASKLADVNDKILFETLLRPEPEMRIGIVRTLSRMGDPSVLGTLLPYFYDPEIRVQNAVKFAFIDFGEESVPYLINVLSNPAPQTQLAVLGLFEALKSPQSLSPMILLFDNENQRVREGAIYTVSTFGSEARDALGEALNNHSEEIVLNSIELLGEIRDLDSLRYLMTLLDSDVYSIRDKTFETVILFGAEAGDQFLRILDRREEENYGSAVKGLMVLNDERLVTDNRTSLFNSDNRNKALIYNSTYDELIEYLDSITLSGLLERDVAFIKEIYDVSFLLIRTEREISESGSRYTTFYISRNDFLLKSDEALQLSFSYMHNYMESRNPEDLETAKQQKQFSEMFKTAAEDLDRQLETYIGSTDLEKELISSFESARNKIITLYESISINRKNLADDILKEFNLTYDKIISGNF